MSYVRWALIVVALTALIGAASGPSLGVTTAIGVPGHPPNLDNATVDRLINQSGGIQAANILAGLVGVVGLVLLLVAYLKWRDGTKSLERAGWEYGAQQLTEARNANSDRRVAFVVYLVQLLIGIIVAVILFEILYQVFQARAPTGVPLAPGQLDQLQQQLSDTILAAAVLTWITNLSLYFFASRSLGRAIGSIVPTPSRPGLESARAVMVVGAALTIVSVLVVVTPYALLASVISPLVIAYGVQRFIDEYDRWLVAPPPLAPIGYIRTPF